jgi:7SK snRNA methylphosphate capping enzyme
VIIPPNIYDPLHLMDPVDSVEYEMQLCSPLKRPKNKHRNRKKRKQNKDSSTDAGNVSSNVESDGESQLPVPAAMTSATIAVEMVAKVEAKKENDREEIARRLLERDKAVKNMKLELSNADNMRKRRISETSTNCVNYKIRRMDSLDKIVSPVIPQPGELFFFWVFVQVRFQSIISPFLEEINNPFFAMHMKIRKIDIFTFCDITH